MGVQLSKQLGEPATVLDLGHQALFVSEHKNWRRRPTGLLSLSEPGHRGCACSMLTDDADWSAPNWDLKTEVLPLIANTLEQIASISPEGFSFEALWTGDRPKQTLKLSLPELKERVLSNLIGTRTRYQVIVT